MAKKNTLLDKLNIDDEKLKMIEFWVEYKDGSTDVAQIISDAVNNVIDKLYVKKVPKDVRIYLDSKAKKSYDNIKDEIKETDDNGENN